MPQENNKKKTGKIVLGVVILAALIAVFALVYCKFSEKPVAGAKAITIEVTDNEDNSTTYEVNTDAEYLRQAMDEADGLTYSGSESEYGMMVDTINGIVADYNENGAYWAFYVNGEYCNYGIDSQPVEDGDDFSIVYESAQ